MSIDSEEAEEYSVSRGELSGVYTRTPPCRRGLTTGRPRQENAVTEIALKRLDRAERLVAAEHAAGRRCRTAVSMAGRTQPGRHVRACRRPLRLRQPDFGAQDGGAGRQTSCSGRKITDFIHPDSLAAVRAHIAARQRDGDTESTPLETGDRHAGRRARVRWKRWRSGRCGRAGPLTRWCSAT